MTIGDGTVIARSASVVASEVDGELMMMSIERGQYFSLNDIASDVWGRLAEPRTFGALVEQLAGDYAAPPDAIAADLRALLASMRERDVIELR
jgi:hypothetical protein